MSLDQILMLPPGYGFDSAGFTPASLGGLLAEYDFLQGANPLVLYDKKPGGGANGTVVSGVTWSSYGLTTASGSKWATTGVSAQSAKTVLIYYSPPSGGTPSIYANSGAVSDLTALYCELIGIRAYGDVGPRLRDLNTSANTTARHNVSQWPYCLGYTMGTPVKQYTNGVEATIYDGQSNVADYTPDANNIRLSNNFVNTGSTEQLYCYALFFSDVKTEDEIAQCYEYMKEIVDARSVPVTGPAALTNDLLLLTGNSITNGLTTASIPTVLSFEKMKQGLGGASTSQWLELAEQAVNPMFRPLSLHNYIFLWPTAMVTTTAEVDSVVVPYAAAMRSAGWKVVIGTSLSSTTGDAAKNIVNAYYDTLMAGASPPFDGLADFRSIPEVSDDGAYANGTYFIDGLHLQTAAYDLIHPVLGAAIDDVASLNVGLVAYYKMGEASGSMLDSVGSANLTASGSPGSGAGIIGNGRTFNSASTQYFSGSLNFDLAAQWTIDGWVKVTDKSTYRVLLACNNTTNWHLYVFAGANGTIRFAGPSGSPEAVGPNIPAGTPFYFRIDYNAGNVGLSINNGTPATCSFVSALTSSTFEVGGRGSGSFPTQGTMDEIGYWNRLFTTAEKAERYNSGALKQPPFV